MPVVTAREITQYRTGYKAVGKQHTQSCYRRGYLHRNNSDIIRVPLFFYPSVTHLWCVHYFAMSSQNCYRLGLHHDIPSASICIFTELIITIFQLACIRCRPWNMLLQIVITNSNYKLQYCISLILFSFNFSVVFFIEFTITPFHCLSSLRS